MRPNGALLVAQLLLLSALAARAASASNVQLLGGLGSVAGGEIEKDVNDPKYWRLAQDSLVKHEQDHGFTLCHQVLRIMKVTEQTVSGLTTKLHFMAHITTDKGSLTMSCHSEIWEQAWIGRKDIKVKCNPVVY